MAVPANSAARPYLQRRRVTGLAPAERPHATQEEEERLLPKAVQVIIYTACLHSALYDLMDEMAQIGEYRHRKRRYLNMCIEKVGYIHTALFKTIGAHSDHFGQVVQQTTRRCGGKHQGVCFIAITGASVQHSQGVIPNDVEGKRSVWQVSMPCGGCESTTGGATARPLHVPDRGQAYRSHLGDGGRYERFNKKNEK